MELTDYDALLEKIRFLGMDYKWAIMFVKKLRDDENSFPVANDEMKKWAIERGFYPGRIELYSLTEDNYRKYVPDYQYFMLHPMNNHFLKWLDKTTLKYVLNSNGCEKNMPDYYIYIENDGSFTYLMNCPTTIKKNEEFLLNLLKEKGTLALKPNSGTSGGLGFIKLELDGNDIYENGRLIDARRFTEMKNSLRNYIVTEYAYQHHELAAIWPDSECTLRVIMCKNPREDLYALTSWSCAVSYARFGTSVNGRASNLSSGGVGVGFDFETGQFQDFCIRYKRFTPDGQWMLDKHPDTKIEWRTRGLPNWDYVKAQIYGICQHVSSLDYLGLDIIITENGMKLCEINSHPAIDYEQIMCGPTLSRENIRSFFSHKGLFDYHGDDFYRAYIESQE